MAEGRVTVAELIEKLKAMPPEERREVLNAFCPECGDYIGDDPKHYNQHRDE